MKRLTFLQSIGTFLLIPFPKREKGISELNDAYIDASLELHKYREDNGFVPGARVKCTSGKDDPKYGNVAPFGEDWFRMDATCVPVILDSGRIQPWYMSDLTILS